MTLNLKTLCLALSRISTTNFLTRIITCNKYLVSVLTDTSLLELKDVYMPLKITICILITFQLHNIGIFAQADSTGFLCRTRELQAWEVLSQNGKYEEAIVELTQQIDLDNKRLNNKDYWHLGQLYAYKNDYIIAIYYLKKSTNLFDRIFDKEWRFYYKGTIAFLKRDKDKLLKYYEKLQKQNSTYYKRNANTLKSLYENFEKGYFEAYNNK
ncbi:MAG: hypothetical protein PHW82_04550 [Bacteroidales bacterium]|nr:hypothetical protein [Bacteroidales bacterium]